MHYHAILHTDTQIALCCSGSLSLCDSNPRTRPSPQEGLLITRLDHRGGGFGVHLGRFEFGISEKFLNLLQRHPPFSQCGRHRVPEQMGVDPLVNPGECGGLLDQLLDTPRGIAGVADGFEEIALGPIAEIGPQLVR
jgi:hypothetical protein